MSNTSMQNALKRLTDSMKKTAFTWLLIRGILAIILGLILFFAPIAGGITMTVFIVVSIGVWLIVDGFAGGSLAFQQRRAGEKGWGWILAAGIIAIIAGALSLIYPLSTGIFLIWMLLYFVAFGLLLRGIAEMFSRGMGGWGIALGIIDVIFGIVMLIIVISAPLAAMLSLAWVLGIYGVIFGIGSIGMAIRVRHL